MMLLYEYGLLLLEVPSSTMSQETNDDDEELIEYS
jgi:hypothetical protein